jgi:hypothetical protein
LRGTDCKGIKREYEEAFGRLAAILAGTNTLAVLVDLYEADESLRS